MVNAVVIAIVLLAVFFAVRYIVKEKAAGKKCIGCPDAGGCGKNCNCGTKERTKM